MRLLQVTTIPETIEAFLLPLVRHMRARGWQVDGAAGGVQGNAACVAAFDAVHDVPWSRNPVNLDNVRAWRAIRKVVAMGGYDVVHVHTPVAAFVTRLAVRGLTEPPALIYSAHGFHFHAGGHPLKNALFKGLEKLAGPWTDRLVTMNGEDFDAAKRLRLVPPERLALIPGIGFDIDGFLARIPADVSREATRSELGLQSTAFVLIMVAELNDNKRQLDAIEAVVRLRAGGLDARLLLVGAGPMREALEKRVANLGLEAAVQFLGYRRDVPTLLRAADALLLLSEREGLPRSVMEAMALGVPVVGTDIRGTRDLLEGGAGQLVAVGDVDGIVEAVRRIAHDPEVAARATRSARTKVQAYSLEEVLAAYDTMYERALADGGR